MDDIFGFGLTLWETIPTESKNTLFTSLALYLVTGVISGVFSKNQITHLNEAKAQIEIASMLGGFSDPLVEGREKDFFDITNAKLDWYAKTGKKHLFWQKIKEIIFLFIKRLVLGFSSLLLAWFLISLLNLVHGIASTFLWLGIFYFSSWGIAYLARVLFDILAILWDVKHSRDPSNNGNLFLIYFRDSNGIGGLSTKISIAREDWRRYFLVLWIYTRSRDKLERINKRLHNKSLPPRGVFRYLTSIIAPLLDKIYVFRSRKHILNMLHPEESLLYCFFHDSSRSLGDMDKLSVFISEKKRTKEVDSTKIKTYLKAQDPNTTIPYKAIFSRIEQGNFISSGRVKLVQLDVSFIKEGKTCYYQKLYAATDVFAMVREIFNDIYVTLEETGRDSMFLQFQIRCEQDEGLFGTLNELFAHEFELCGLKELNVYYLKLVDDFYHKINLSLFAKEKPIVLNVSDDFSSLSLDHDLPAFRDNVPNNKFINRVALSRSKSHLATVPLFNIYQKEHADDVLLYQWALELLALGKSLKSIGWLPEDQYCVLTIFAAYLRKNSKSQNQLDLPQSIQKSIDDTTRMLGPRGDIRWTEFQWKLGHYLHSFSTKL